MTDAQTAQDWTTKTLAAAAGVSTRYIRQELAAGKFHGARKLGRDWIIPYGEGLRWLEERREKKSPTE